MFYLAWKSLNAVFLSWIAFLIFCSFREDLYQHKKSSMKNVIWENKNNNFFWTLRLSHLHFYQQMTPYAKINICSLVVLHFALIWRWIKDFKIEFDKHYLMMTIKIQWRMNSRFHYQAWLALPAKFGWLVNIRSAEEDEFLSFSNSFRVLSWFMD